MADTRMPVTLLTGFLGAGKSTLLNKIIATPQTERIAVIVNEFGEIGLDHDLIETSGEEVLLMSSGCICCSIRDDLAQTISDLLERRKEGAFEFERIVIETTGLADPAPIQQTFLVDRILATTTRLDGIVTLVDAANGQDTLDAQFEAVSQAATADLLLLTKAELVSGEELASLHKRLEGLNPTADILRVDDAVRSPERLWGLSGLKQDTTPQNALAWMSRDATPVATFPQVTADPLANLSGLASAQPTSTFSPHDERIATASIILDVPLEDAIFDRWLDTLVALKGRDLLRVKGIVFLKGIETPFVFHGVQHIFAPPVALRGWDKEDTQTRIVVIARDMTEAELNRSLDMLRAKRAIKQPPVFPGWKDVERQNWPE